jgi:hypothetical protein
MSATSKRILAAVLILVSVGCAIGFAVCVGSVMHTAQRAVGAGGPAPSATGYIVTALTLLGTFLPASWAKWLMTAANALPVIESTIGTLKGVTIKSTPSPGPISPLATLFGLLESIDLTSDGAASKGSHSIPGGVVTWDISFQPTKTEVTP